MAIENVTALIQDTTPHSHLAHTSRRKMVILVICPETMGVKPFGVLCVRSGYVSLRAGMGVCECVHRLTGGSKAGLAGEKAGLAGDMREVRSSSSRFGVNWEGPMLK